jgi:hypothetical protein
MKPILFLLAAIIAFQTASAQDSIHVLRQYENDRPDTQLDSVFNKIPNVVYISFDEGFNDSVLITVNNVIYMDGYLRSNESLGYAGGFVLSFNDSADTQDLKIKFVKTGRYIEEKVNLKYKALHIRKPDQWLLTYTNHFVMLQ